MPVEPGKWRHYKGGVYTVLFTAQMKTEEGEEPEVVIYRGENGRLYARTIDNFCGAVEVLEDRMRYRFERVEIPNV